MWNVKKNESPGSLRDGSLWVRSAELRGLGPAPAKVWKKHQLSTSFREKLGLRLTLVPQLGNLFQLDHQPARVIQSASLLAACIGTITKLDLKHFKRTLKHQQVTFFCYSLPEILVIQEQPKHLETSEAEFSLRGSQGSGFQGPNSRLSQVPPISRWQYLPGPCPRPQSTVTTLVCKKTYLSWE